MSRRLPPLGALRAFEAAARHASFARAAEELHITAAAVSQQVRNLEDYLGLRLFARRPRGVELTVAGGGYAHSLGGLLDQLAQVTEHMRRPDAGGRLTIATTPSFAARWLMPRLIRFMELHPELDVRLSTSNTLADFSQQDIDVGVRYGTGRWHGLEARLLTETSLFPVCSPAVRQGPPTLRRPADLRPRSLLRLMTDDWPCWLRAANLDMKAEGAQYSDSALLAQAAAAGHGVILGQSVIVADDLAAGILVEPFELRIATDLAYYIVGLPESLERPAVKAFEHWLRDELSEPPVGKYE